MSPKMTYPKEYTGFDYVDLLTTEAEARVVAAGYPWASTSILRQPGPLPRRGQHIYYDYLGIHAHSGDNTHLIVSGEVTIRQHPVCTPPYTLLTLPSGLNKSRYTTLSLDIEGSKELPVGPGEIYEGTTQRGANFVEAHRCLSPTTAARFMRRNTIRWIEDGAPVPEQVQHQIMNTLVDEALQFHWTRGSAPSVVVPPGHGLSAATRLKLYEWFKKEWEAHDMPWRLSDRPPKRAVDVKGLYPAPAKSWSGRKRGLASSPAVLRATPKWVPHSYKAAADT